MPSATELANKKGGGTAANLLHGSDFPPKLTTLTVKIIAAREAPETFKSPLILDIEEKLPGKTALALNVTNTRVLAEMLGDDYFRWPGASITLTRVPQRNPQTNQQGWGIAVTGATPFRGSRGKPAAAASRAKSTSKKSDKSTKTQANPADDDIPF